MKKSKRIVNLCLTFLLMFSVVFADFNLQKAEAAGDMDAPVLERVEFKHVGEVGKANDHKLEFEIQAYDALSGIKDVWVRYFYTDATDPTDTVDDNDGYAFEHDFSGQTVIYRGFTSVAPDPNVPSGKNYIFKGEIELNDFPGAGNVIIDDIRLVDYEGNAYYARDSHHNSSLNNNAQWPYKLGDFKYTQPINSAIVKNTDVIVNGIEYDQRAVALTTTRKDMNWNVSDNNPFNADPQTPTYDSDAFIEARVEFDFSKTVANYEIGITDVALVFEDKNVPYSFHLSGASNSSGYNGSLGTGGILKFGTSTFVRSDVTDSNQVNYSCSPKAVIIRWNDGHEEIVDITPSPSTSFNVENWHAGVDGRGGNLANIIYYVNGNTTPYDLHNLNTRDLHYGDTVTAEADVPSSIIADSDTKVTFCFSSYYGQHIYVDATQVSGTRYKADLYLDGKDMNPTLWYLESAYVRRNSKMVNDYVTNRGGSNNSFLIRLTDGSTQLPIQTREYNISSWNLSNLEDAGHGNVVKNDTFIFNFVPEIDDTDKLLSELTNVRPSGATPSEMTFTGWKVEKLVFNQLPDGQSEVSGKILIDENSDLPISISDYFEITAVYDKSIYSVNYEYATKETQYGIGKLFALGSIDDLKNVVKDITTDIDGVTITDWQVIQHIDMDRSVDLGLLSALTSLPNNPDSYWVTGIELVPVYSQPIKMVSYYYYDFSSPEELIKQGWEFMADPNGDGSTIAASLTAKYSSIYPAELGLTGYKVEVEHQPVGDIYVVKPITTNKVLFVYASEYLNGGLVYQNLATAHIIAEADIDDYVASIKENITPISNGETVENFEVFKYPEEDFWSTLVTQIDLNAKYEGKNILFVNASIDDSLACEIGNGVILVDETTSMDDILAELLGNDEVKNYAAELGISDWQVNTSETSIDNFGAFTIMPVSRSKNYVCYELDGGNFKVVKGAEIGDQIDLPATLGPVHDIFWARMRIKGDFENSSFVDGDFSFFDIGMNPNTPATVLGDTVIYGDGVFENPVPSPVPTPNQPSDNGGNSGESTGGSSDSHNAPVTGNYNSETQKSHETSIPNVPTSQGQGQTLTGMQEVPPTVTVTDENGEEIEEPIEEEEVPLASFSSKNGEVIEIEVTDEKTKEVLEKVIENSDTIDQRKAEKLADELGEMPAENEKTSEVKTSEDGKTTVTEEVKIGTDSIEINDKGEVQLNKDAVDEIKDSIQEALKKTEEVKNANSDATVETPQVVIEMGAASVVSEEIFKAISGKNVDVVIKKNGYYWTINGNDISSSKPIALNLAVDFDTSNVPSGVVADLAGNSPATQLSLAHNGDFGLKAKLTVELGELGTKNVGQYGNLYYYDSNGKLVFQNAGVINKDGTVSLDFSHASDYVVVIGADATPKSHNVTVIVSVVIAALVAAGAAAFVILKRKKVEE